MIEFHNVSKRYGNTVAIDHLNTDIENPGIYCLLGRNGAGKTTFMKLLAGYIDASEGLVAINGDQVSTHHMSRGVTFIESSAAQFNMPLKDLLRTAADVQDSFDIDFAQQMMHQYELDSRKKYKQLSFGMKTMFNTILVMASNSSVILLDEPTLGFDAIMRKQFNELLLSSYEAHPRIIIISTHLLDEISKVVQHLIIIDEGHLVLRTDMDEIDEHTYSLTGATSLVKQAIDGLNCIGSTVMGSVMAAYIYDRRIEPPQGVSLERLSLEDFFINLVGGTK